MDISNAAFVRLPPGPERDARDADIRLARDEWDDGSLKHEFEGLAGLFCYEAEDAAQVRLQRPTCRENLTYVALGVVGDMGALCGARKVSPVRAIQFPIADGSCRLKNPCICRLIIGS